MEVDEAAAADAAAKRLGEYASPPPNIPRVDMRVAQCPACGSLGRIPADWVECSGCGAAPMSARACKRCRGCGWLRPEDDAVDRLS